MPDHHVMVEHSPVLDPKGYKRRHLRVYVDKDGRQYVNIGRRNKQRRYLDTMAYRVNSADPSVRVYFEECEPLPRWPNIVRPAPINHDTGAPATLSATVKAAVPAFDAGQRAWETAMGMRDYTGSAADQRDRWQAAGAEAARRGKAPIPPYARDEAAEAWIFGYRSIRPGTV